ncbi:MAG: family 78 glycoside hydrolase catalytic domain, partial [Bacilli bacterium]
MLEIVKFTCEHLTKDIVTDNPHPYFAFCLSADCNEDSLKKATITLGDWTSEITELGIRYEGKALQPLSTYTATLEAEDIKGQKVSSSISFSTGFLNSPWKARWISDASFSFTEKGVSPVPMYFRKKLAFAKKVKSAKIYATSMGIYDLLINGKKVSNRYFAPGFTSYKTQLQYQCYDVSSLLTGNDTLDAVIAGGWAVGSFVFTRQNRVTHNRQALLLEMHVVYEDGQEEIIPTDETWSVTEKGNVTMADIYDGETYDSTIDLDKADYHQASFETLKINPKITAEYGSPVHSHEIMEVKNFSRLEDGKLIYDFGQNFAGVILLEIKNAKKGQKIVVRHAEILKKDGDLNTAFLRSAKATATYICQEGKQTYSPTLTYMGFRYASIEGIDERDIVVKALALYSDVEQIGSFECSDPLINRLQKNIVWSSKSNFVDIPTDCPQRDERMGWTGDISVFSPTAVFNYDMSRFLNKWLLDVKAEQLPTGGIPNTVPVQGYGFPATMPVMAMDFWGDACLMVPWAEYQATGNKEILETMYETMRKYVNACRFWASFGIGKHRYIWHTPSILHFGDWVAPDSPKMSQWQARSKWTATASLKRTSKLLSDIAKILGKEADYQKYLSLSKKVDSAYVSIFSDGNGKMKNEFQTAYVLPIYFDIFKGEEKKKAAENLANLVIKNDYCIGTGFPGTPYILFALADNGKPDVAFRMLTNTKCPSWLYEVRVGATTIWERWDGLDENGECEIGDDGTGGMISFNHYASGAVGDFLYRRVAGIEQTLPGYQTLRIAPLIGGGITSCKASTMC